MANIRKGGIRTKSISVDTVIDICLSNGIFSERDNLTAELLNGGNINYTFRVSDSISGKSVIIKIAQRESKISKDLVLNVCRGKNESYVLDMYNRLIPGISPYVYGYDNKYHALIMQDLSPNVLMEEHLFDFNRVNDFPDMLADFLSKVIFFTSDFYIDHKKKRVLQSKFKNQKLCDLTEKLVFTEPYFPADNNSFDERNSDYVRLNIYNNNELKDNIAELKTKFLTSSQSLLHGDLHFGSVFTDSKKIIIFDPEFAFYGPAGYDIGNIISHLIIHYYHSIFLNTGNDFSEWIKNCIISTVALFRQQFLDLCSKQTNDMVLKSVKFSEKYAESIIVDAAGFAGTECIRRVIGLAKVKTLTDKTCEQYRSKIEKGILNAATTLICKRNIMDFNNLISDALCITD